MMFRTAMNAAIALSLIYTGQAATRITQPVTTSATVPVQVFHARVVARYPHASDAFTEGLAWQHGAIYESVGLEGKSEVRKVRLVDGRILARAALPSSQFGEGLAALPDELVSLTWHDGIAHRWQPDPLHLIGNSHYAGEGWGLTSDGKSLILSDGSAALHFLDPETLTERRRVIVRMPNGHAITQLNELEWVDGCVLANVWHTGFLLRVDPNNGRVTGIVDLRLLVTSVKMSDPEAVLNGIAYDPVRKRMFVTGKLWPSLFQIVLEPVPISGLPNR